MKKLYQKAKFIPAGMWNAPKHVEKSLRLSSVWAQSIEGKEEKQKYGFYLLLYRQPGYWDIDYATGESEYVPDKFRVVLHYSAIAFAHAFVIELTDELKDETEALFYFEIFKEKFFNKGEVEIKTHFPTGKLTDAFILEETLKRNPELYEVVKAARLNLYGCRLDEIQCDKSPNNLPKMEGAERGFESELG